MSKEMSERVNRWNLLHRVTDRIIEAGYGDPTPECIADYGQSLHMCWDLAGTIPQRHRQVDHSEPFAA